MTTLKISDYVLFVMVILHFQRMPFSFDTLILDRLIYSITIFGNIHNSLKVIYVVIGAFSAVSLSITLTLICMITRFQLETFSHMDYLFRGMTCDSFCCNCLDPETLCDCFNRIILFCSYLYYLELPSLKSTLFFSYDNW